MAVTVILQATPTQSEEAKHPHALWKTSQILPAYSKSLCMQGKGQNTEHRHMCQQGSLQPLAQQVQRATLCHPPRAKVKCVTAGLAPSPWHCPSTEHVCSTCKGEWPLYTVLFIHRGVVIQEQPHSIHAPGSRSPVQGTPLRLQARTEAGKAECAESGYPPALLKAKIPLAVYGATISCTVNSFLWTQLSVSALLSADRCQSPSAQELQFWTVMTAQSEEHC